jgi:hypothetical protein
MADATAKAETAQALFCAIIDYVGLDKIPDPLTPKGKNLKIDTYKGFLNYYKVKFRGKLTIAQIFNKVEADASLREVEALLLSNAEWYLSSIRIAIKLLADIKSVAKLSGWKSKNVGRAGWQSVMYRRGDKEVMGTIAKLFSEANKGQKNFNDRCKPKTPGQYFGDVNKWNPADIYWSTPGGVAALKKELDHAKKLAGVYKFDDLNNVTCKLIASGDLLPLSLKKNAHGNISIVLVNFAKQTELNSVATYSAGTLVPATFGTYKGKKLTGVVGSTPGKRKLTLGGADGNRDFILNIRVGGKEKKGMKLKCRHDSAGSGPSKWLVQIFEAGKGESAGSLVGREGLTQQMKLAGDSNGATAWGKKFDDAESDFKDVVGTNAPKKWWVDDGEGETISLREMYLKGKNHKTPQDNEYRDRYIFHAANASGKYFANGPIAGFHAWLVTGMKTDRTDRFVRNVYLYATSRSNTSGRFVIAK